MPSSTRIRSSSTRGHYGAALGQGPGGGESWPSKLLPRTGSDLLERAKVVEATNALREGEVVEQLGKDGVEITGAAGRLAEMSGKLREASQGRVTSAWRRDKGRRGNGKAWVGPDYTVASDGKTLLKRRRAQTVPSPELEASWNDFRQILNNETSLTDDGLATLI